MRGGRSFLVLLVLALGLGSYIYFVEMKRDPADSTAKKDKLFTLEPGKIEELEVKAAGGDVTKLKKAGDEWQIVGAETIPADTSAVTTIASTLESLEIQRIIDENPAAVKDYELDPARFYVSFKATGDTAMRRLNVGAKTPTGGDLYARVDGQPRVVLISAFLEDSLNKTTFDLREKSVLKFSRDGVDHLLLEADGQPTLEFARKADVWRLTKPVDAKADFTPVDGIVGQVFQARMKSLVSPTAPSPEDVKKFGFDKPQARVTLGAGSSRATLEIGAKKDDASLYARDVTRPMVFTVENALLDGVKRKADDLRAKELFEFRTFTAVGADFSLRGQTYTFKKEKDDKPATTPLPSATPVTPSPTPTPAAEVWKMLKPTAKETDQTKMTDLLTAASNLRVEKFADKAHASGEDLTVTVRFGDAASPTEEKVTFRKSGDVVHAIRQGEGGAAVIPTADYDKVVTQLKELAGVK